MSTRADEEREDRLHCSMLDGPSEPGWVDDADTYEPAPFTARVSLVKRTAPKCTRQASPLVARGPRRGPCGGRIVAGRCTECGRPPRTLREDA